MILFIVNAPARPRWAQGRPARSDLAASRSRPCLVAGLVMLSDMLPTGFECGVLNGKVAPDSTVAIVGSGPIGLAALLTAQRNPPLPWRIGGLRASPKSDLPYGFSIGDCHHSPHHELPAYAVRPIVGDGQRAVVAPNNLHRNLGVPGEEAVVLVTKISTGAFNCNRRHKCICGSAAAFPDSQCDLSAVGRGKPADDVEDAVNTRWQRKHPRTECKGSDEKEGRNPDQNAALRWRHICHCEKPNVAKCSCQLVRRVGRISEA
jgi:hypothetical protein